MPPTITYCFGKCDAFITCFDFLRLSRGLQRFLSGDSFDDTTQQGAAGRVISVKGEQQGASLLSKRKLLECEESLRGSVEGFDVLGIDLERGCAVASAGTVVFWGVVSCGCVG